MTDDVLLRHIAKKGKPVIISTGMAYMDEVKHAVEVIKNEGNDQIVVLHCVSLYPPESKDLNLKAIQTLRKELSRPVGYSDHAEPSSNAATLGAITLGACLIERHITDSQEGNSNDDKNSMTIDQFRHMVSEIRSLEAALSRSGVKEPISAPDREVDEVKEKEDVTVVGARILTSDERYKKMIIGRGGKRVKEIGQMARRELEAATNSKIFLDLNVEVDPHWVESV
jgi:sialic acid synthase SpsE